MASWLPRVSLSEANAGFQTSRISWGLTLGAQKPGEICQRRCKISPAGLKVRQYANPKLILAVLGLKMASWLGPCWPVWGQTLASRPPELSRDLRSGGPLLAVSSLRMDSLRGLGLGARMPGEICQDRCNISLDGLKTQIPRLI